MPIDLNQKDIAILRLLQQDASLTSTAIAERLHLSQSPCWRRINHIEQEGLIRRRVALLDREKLGMDAVVFATLTLAQHDREHIERFENEIRHFPEVMECYTLTGAADYLLKIVARDLRHYERFMRDRLLPLARMGDVHSHIAVTEIKSTTELPLDTQMP